MVWPSQAKAPDLVAAWLSLWLAVYIFPGWLAGKPDPTWYLGLHYPAP